MSIQQISRPGAGIAEDLRGKLIAAAFELLESGGVEALTVRAVASAAGVSHGAPARHFDSIKDLKAEVAAIGHKMVADEIQVAVRGRTHGNDPKEPLITAGLAYVRFALNHPGLFSLIVRIDTLGLDNQALRRERRSASGRFLKVVEQAQSRGWKPDADPTRLAMSLWASAHGLATLWMNGVYQHSNPGSTLEDAVSAIYDLG